MQENNLTFSYQEIANQHIGANISYQIQEQLDFPDFQSTSPLTATVQLMKLKEGISVTITGLQVQVKIPCSRSNKLYQATVSIPEIQRTFYLQQPAPEQQKDPFDIYLVNKKRNNLDITELLRQEIILHFPADPVCFTSKKDICQYCSFDLKRFKEQEKEQNNNKPLSILKDLINTHAKTSSTKKENN